MLERNIVIGIEVGKSHFAHCKTKTLSVSSMIHRPICWDNPGLRHSRHCPDGHQRRPQILDGTGISQLTLNGARQKCHVVGHQMDPRCSSLSTRILHKANCVE